MSVFLLVLWGCSAAAKLSTALLLLARRVGGPLPYLLLISVAKSAYLATLWGSPQYRIAWRQISWVDHTLACLLTIEACYLLAAHFPMPSRVTVFTTTIFGAITAFAVFHLDDGSPVWMHEVGVAVRDQRWFASLCLGVLVLNAALHAMPRIVWRRNATRMLIGTGTMLVLEVAGLCMIKAQMSIAAGQMLCLCAPIAACLWWARMDQSGNDTPPIQPDPMATVLDSMVRGIRKTAGL